MKSKIIIIITLILSLAKLSAYSEKDYNCDVVENNDGSIEIELSLNAPVLENITTASGTFSQINNAGSIQLSEKGFAALPFINLNVQLDNQSDYSLEIKQKTSDIVTTDYQYLPSKGVLYRNQNPADFPLEVSKKALTSDLYPAENEEASAPYILRDIRGMAIKVFPIQYNSATKELKYLTHVSYKLVKNKQQSTNPLTTSAATIKSFQPLYNTIFVNYKEDRGATLADDGDILVIYSPLYKEPIQPWINWKRMMGYQVKELEVERGTVVKDIVTAEYAANSNLLYVQLVGDINDVSSELVNFGNSTGGICPTDPVLGCVAGDDHYADLIVGRFSANNAAELTVQVNKTITYEKDTQATGHKYNKALGIASNEGQYGDDSENDQQHMENIKANKLMPYDYTNVDEVYQTLGGNASNISAAVNSGVGLINYVGHGQKNAWQTPWFDNTNIASLNDNATLPVIVSVACLNGKFNITDGDCFGETWLKKDNGGAAAVLMSTINQPWTPPMRGQDYFNDMLIEGYSYSAHSGQSGANTTAADKRYTFGSLAFNALAMMLAERNQSDDIETTQTWTIFGDATLMVRTDDAKEFSLTNTSFVVGEDATINTAVNSAAVHNVKTTISQNGIFVKGQAATDGKTHSFDTSVLKPGKAILTVAGYNMVTEYKEVDILAPAAPFVFMDSYEISDTNNNLPDFGETITLTITLNNAGNSSLSGLNITFDESDFVSEFAQPSAQDFALGMGETKTITIPVTIKSDIEDQQDVMLNYTIKNSDNRVFEEKVEFTVNSHILALTGDALTTTNFNPGFNGDVSYQLSNSGQAGLSNATVSINSSQADHITFSPAEISLGSIGSSAQAQSVFTMNVDNNITEGTQVLVTLTLQADNGLSKIFEHVIHTGFHESFESNDFSNLDWQLDGNVDWFTSNATSANGTYSAQSGDINHNQTSEITVTRAYQKAGKIYFDYKVSAEGNDWGEFFDGLQFYIDGSKAAEWSGEQEWTSTSFDVSSGNHTFKWRYKKDESDNGGQDCAWIDNILFDQSAALSIEEEGSNALAQSTELFQNYPNPFNPSTTIKFYQPNFGQVYLKVYNSMGQVVRSLVNEQLSAGYHTINFNAAGLNSGIYFYSLKAGNATQFKKMVLTK